jgi:hypothetical protein
MWYGVFGFFWYNLPVMSEKLNIVPIETQYDWVKNANNLAEYMTLYGQLFSMTTMFRWETDVTKYSQENAAILSNEYFHLLGVSAVLGAQYGFTSMTGQSYRHVMNKWENRHYLAPIHTLSQLSYIGFINTQSYPVKEAMIEKAKELGREDDAPLVWLEMLYPDKGKIEVAPLYSEEDFNLKLDSLREKHKRRPVLLPDKKLNQKLADWRFKGDDADKMPLNEFMDTVVPHAGIILQGLVNVEKLFVDNL